MSLYLIILFLLVAFGAGFVAGAAWQDMHASVGVVPECPDYVEPPPNVAEAAPSKTVVFYDPGTRRPTIRRQ